MLTWLNHAQIFWNLADKYFSKLYTVEWFGEVTLLNGIFTVHKFVQNEQKDRTDSLAEIMQPYFHWLMGHS
jgi:hypothetical protein